MAASVPEQERILQASIEELRRSYDHVSNIYDQLRLKALALIAGEVAIVTFIFSGNHNHTPKGADRLIFFYGGLIALLIAFGLLLWLISSVRWRIAHDSLKAKRVLEDYTTYYAFLNYLHDYHSVVNKHCTKIVSDKSSKFNWIVYLLAAGVIILIVLTRFGGQ